MSHTNPSPVEPNPGSANRVYLIVALLVGGVLVALLGWYLFTPRKYPGSDPRPGMTFKPAFNITEPVATNVMGCPYQIRDLKAVLKGAKGEVSLAARTGGSGWESKLQLAGGGMNFVRFVPEVEVDLPDDPSLFGTKATLHITGRFEYPCSELGKPSVRAKPIDFAEEIVFPES